MRVMLTTDCVGGVWTFAKELTAELLRRGHAVALISLGRLPSPEQAIWCASVARQFPGAFRFEASPVPLEWEQANEASYAGAEAALLRYVEEFAPDVLHTSQFCFGRLPAAVPKVITAHSDVLSWAEACRPSGLEPSPWLRRYRTLVADGLAAADAVVAPTQWMLEALRRHFALPSKQVVIANGRTLPDDQRSEGRKLQAVSVGRLWDEAKNIRLLAGIESPLPMVVAGDEAFGDEALADRGSVQALGRLSEDTVLDLFHESSVYVATSVYEPFGLAPLEAALCGCAVLANDIPSLREVWAEAALYFHDAASLTGLLREWVTSPALLEGARARSGARAKELTAARMADGYVALYSSLINEAGCVLPGELAAYAA